MSDVTVKMEGAEAVLALLAKLPANAKFGAALGMNRTMDEAQTAIKAGLSSRFTLRRKSFVESTVYRKPGVDWATKDKLEARVQVNPDRDQLAKFEEGGTKSPRSGKALGVPVIGGARPTKGALVPDKFKLKAIFFGQQGLLAQARTIAGTKKQSSRNTLLRASVKKYASLNGKVFEIIGTKRAPRLKLLWVFKPSVRIAPRLGFVKTGREVIERRAEANVSGAIEVEITRGLTTKSGVTP